MLFFPRCCFGLSVCQFFISFFSCKLLHIFSLIAEKKEEKKRAKNCMKSKRVLGYSSQEYEEEDLAYDTPERKKKQKGGGRSNSKVVNNNGTFFVFTSLI